MAGYPAFGRSPGLDSGGGAAQNRQGRMKRLGAGIRGAVVRPQTAVRVPAGTSCLPLASRLDPAALFAPYPANRLSTRASRSALSPVTLLASACRVDGSGLLRLPGASAIDKNPVWAPVP